MPTGNVASSNFKVVGVIHFLYYSTVSLITFHTAEAIAPCGIQW